MFAALVLKTTVNVEVLGITKKVELNWAAGMIGSMPVFESKAEAEAYAGVGNTEEIKYKPNVK